MTADDGLSPALKTIVKSKQNNTISTFKDTYILDFSVDNHDQGTINIDSGIDVIIQNISNGGSLYVNAAQKSEGENDNEFSIEIDPDNNWNGTFNILLQVFNSDQLSDAETINNIQFTATNDPPELHKSNFEMNENNKLLWKVESQLVVGKDC